MWALIVLGVVGLGSLAYAGIVRLVKLQYAQPREIVPRVLYACGRMNHAIVENAVQRYAIKAIVDLRKEETQPRGLETEYDWARRAGIRYFNFGMKPRAGPEMVSNFLKIVTDPRFQPTLVHCHHGRSRTNLCVAMYRITQQGWTVEKAFEEIRAAGLFPSEHQDYMNFLQRHQHLDWKKLATVDPSVDDDRYALPIRGSR